MIKIIGDIHGDYSVISKHASTYDDVTAIIQVGDFGWHRRAFEYFNEYPLLRPVYAIDGNHEYFEWIDYEEVTEIVPNLFFVPRGSVLKLDGRRIGLRGGAASVDKAYRLSRGIHWDGRENITSEQFERLADVTEVDVLITHCPPQSVIQAHFNPQNLVDYFGLPITWRDPNADLIQTLWDRLGNPMIYSGHMHKSVIGPNYRILDIDEAVDM